MRFPLLAALGAVALAVTLSGCSTSTESDVESSTNTESSQSTSDTGACAGVSVVVDFGVLAEDSADVSACAEADGTIAAVDVLESVDVSTEGSAEWGDQIVCRVNDRPGADEIVEIEGEAAFTESCASMPPAYAYWALWVMADADSDWEYAQEGLGSLTLEPGQSLGLVFTSGTETPTPGS